MNRFLFCSSGALPGRLAGLSDFGHQARLSLSLSTLAECFHRKRPPSPSAVNGVWAGPRPPKLSPSLSFPLSRSPSVCHLIRGRSSRRESTTTTLDLVFVFLFGTEQLRFFFSSLSVKGGRPRGCQRGERERESEKNKKGNEKRRVGKEGNERTQTEKFVQLTKYKKAKNMPRKWQLFSVKRTIVRRMLLLGMQARVKLTLLAWDSVSWQRNTYLVVSGFRTCYSKRHSIYDSHIHSSTKHCTTEDEH